MRIQYNAPVILTFALISTVVLALQQFAMIDLMGFFTLYPELNYTDPIWYLRLFTHVMGHGSWEHLVSNLALILLIGPILEEKYGSRDVLLMMVLTALLTGILHILFFDAALLGASGIVFMMILLGSFTNSQSGYIPLTFILVAVLYLGREVSSILDNDNISQFAHIIGGICGAIFGFIMEGSQQRKKKALPTSKKESPNPS